jgi:hypothetical protein
MKMALLLVAVWFWGMALSSIVGITPRIFFGIAGTVAFIWAKQI